MKTPKLLLAAMLCTCGMQGALILGGSATQTEYDLGSSTFTNGTIVLSDGITLTESSVADGFITDECYTNSQGCHIAGAPYLDIASDNYGFQDGAVGAFLKITYDGFYAAIPGGGVQTYQLHFTATGTASAYLPSGKPCPFPDAGPNSDCTIPVTGSGIVTSTIRTFNGPDFPEAYFITSSSYAFTTAPEPGTPILITAGIGMLALLRKRFSGCRS